MTKLKSWEYIPFHKIVSYADLHSLKIDNAKDFEHVGKALWQQMQSKTFNGPTTAIYSELSVKDWDGEIEVSPVIDNGQFVEVCEPGEETYWSVYLHRRSGGNECIADMPSEGLAKDLARLLKQVYDLSNVSEPEKKQPQEAPEVIPHFSVGSSNGNLNVDRFTGNVLECFTSTDSEGLQDIMRFNVEEFCAYYKYSPENMPSYIDILDIGYWTKDGTYEEPVMDWREMQKQEREQFNIDKNER